MLQVSTTCGTPLRDIGAFRGAHFGNETVCKLLHFIVIHPDCGHQRVRPSASV